MLEFKKKEERKALHVEIESKLLEEAKAEAKRVGLTLREVVEAGFTEFLKVFEKNK